MRSDERIVTKLPMQELWDAVGHFGVRLRYLDHAELRALVSAEPFRFVVADVGHHLAWVAQGDRFSFWKRIGRHVVRSEPVIFEDYPEGLAYRRPNGRAARLNASFYWKLGTKHRSDAHGSPGQARG